MLLSLKLRLNLIITILLILILAAGTLLNILNARENVRAEVESTEKLALYLFDTGILSNPGVLLPDPAERPLRLQSLKHMRHLRVEFYDPRGNLVDSNRLDNGPTLNNAAPDWFGSLMAGVTPAWESKRRTVDSRGQVIGQLVITPDPSYEYAEIWKQMTDLFLLLSVFFITVNLMVFWAVGQALKPTQKILDALNRLEQGDLSARLPIFALPELARIGEKFNRMVETLEQSIGRNHRLSQQLITLQEEERKSLARDLHDEFGQCLTAIHTDATVVLQVAEKKYPEIRESAKAITQLSRHLMDLVSGLLQRLRPGILDELGLAPALHDLVDTWKSRNENLACILMVDAAMPDTLAEPVQVTIYRMVQECLTNVYRHAHATEVVIELSLSRIGRRDALQVRVRDNGRGFDPAVAEGYGLAGMRERVEGLGGKMSLNTHPGAGTEITAWFMLDEDAR
jgi:two-component system sensor histidine kinase UhpB